MIGKPTRAVNHLMNLMTKIHLHDKRKLHIKWFNRLMSKRSNVYQSFIWVKQLPPHGCNDFPLQKCKNQIFHLYIFSQYSWGRDFQKMLLLMSSVTFSFGLSLVIFCFGFLSWEGLHRNIVILLMVGLHRSKDPSMQSDRKILLFHGSNKVS